MAKPLVQATGRRKAAVARVRLRDGGGAITINKRPFEEYFPSASARQHATEPLPGRVCIRLRRFVDIIIESNGGPHGPMIHRYSGINGPKSSVTPIRLPLREPINMGRWGL